MNHDTLVDLRDLVEKLKKNDLEYYNTYIDSILLKLPVSTREKLSKLDAEKLGLLGRIDGMLTHFEEMEKAQEQAQQEQLEEILFLDHRRDDYSDEPL